MYKKPLFVLSYVAFYLLMNSLSSAGDSPLQLAVFRSNVTPPIGHPMTGGYNNPVKSIEDQLEAKGVVLLDHDARYVLCAVDWCGLSNTAYAMFRDKIAEAAKTEASHVAVQCLHVHTAVLADGFGHAMLQKTKLPIAMQDEAFLERVTDRLAREVRKSLGRLHPFDQIGIGQAKVDRVASSRRVMIDGKLHTRMSSARSAELRNLPEGVIDPMVKTITFANGGKPLVRLHYYATHPQSFYGDGRVSSDVPGFARKALEREEKIPQIYFTGCAGNIALGKYNDGTPEARAPLIARLLAGMKAACVATSWHPAESIVWRTTPLRLPLRNDESYNPEKQSKILNDSNARASRRLEAAEYLAFAKRIDEPILLSSLQIGRVHIVNLPGEPFVEYQLFAQRLLPDGFVAVAGYGEYGPVYICTERAFEEGGYEPTEAMAAPRSEVLLQKAIRKLLGL